MNRYSLLFTFFILLAIVASCIGFHYTLVADISNALKVFIYIVLLLEVFVDCMLLVRIWNTKGK